MILLDKVRRLAHQFDVLHFHIDAFHFPLFREMAAKTITTLHGRQDLPDLPLCTRLFQRCLWFPFRTLKGRLSRKPIL